MSIAQLPPIKALICLHNQQLSGPIFKYLSNFGARRVTIADSRAQVNQAVMQDSYNFFLIGQQLPGITGLNLYQFLQVTGSVTDHCISMLCMDSPTERDIIRAKQLGISSIMVPPYSLHKIGDRVQRLYGRGKEKLHFPSQPPQSQPKEARARPQFKIPVVS